MKNKEGGDEVRVRGLAASWIWCWLEKGPASTKGELMSNNNSYREADKAGGHLDDVILEKLGPAQLVGRLRQLLS